MAQNPFAASSWTRKVKVDLPGTTCCASFFGLTIASPTADLTFRHSDNAVQEEKLLGGLGGGALRFFQLTLDLPHWMARKESTSCKRRRR